MKAARAALAAVALAGAGARAGQVPATTTPAVERVSLPPIALRESPSRIETDPAGWVSIQPGPDLAGWTRGAWPATAELGPQQWSVDPATGHLVCDGRGGHEWLRYDREVGDAVLGVEWRFPPVEGAEKYNSGILARTAADLSTWHQAQVGLRGFLFGLVEPTRRVTQEPAAERVRPAGQWNAYEVTARGGTLSLWVNGAVTNEIPVRAARGHFGLEAEGWRVEFRRLALKILE